jgi:hypothetical protein
MVLMINKNPDTAYKTQVLFDGLDASGEGMIYRYDESDLSGIRSEPIDPAAQLGFDLPPYSLTLLVLQPGD